jgi:Protein of unknown function (DUF4230)
VTSPGGKLPDPPLPDGLQQFLRDSQNELFTEMGARLDTEAGLAAIIGRKSEQDAVRPVAGVGGQTAEIGLSLGRSRSIQDDRTVNGTAGTGPRSTLSGTDAPRLRVIISPGRSKIAGGPNATVGGLLVRSGAAKLVIVVAAVLLLAVGGPIAAAHYFAGRNTAISTEAVIGSLSEIEQVHVATGSFAVNVKITQSVGIIPCFLICDQQELKGSGTDDAIVNLNGLSKEDVSINQSTDAVTVRMAAPVIGPADIDPAACTITNSLGVINSATQGFRNNPEAYRPLYAEAATQVHNAAEHDRALLAEAEQSTRAMLTQVLAAVGVKHVTIDFT